MRLTRNAAVALGSHVAVAIVALVATAVLVRILGAEQFGAWMLIGAVVAYGGALDLGLGGALVRRVAAAHAVGDRAGMSRAIGAGVVATVVLGITAGSAVAALAEPIARLVDVPPASRAAFVMAVRISGISLALAVPSVAIGAVPAALQRIDAVIRLDTATTATTLLLQIGVALAGGGLVGLTLVALLARAIGLSGRFWITHRLLAGIPFRVDRRYPFWTELGRFGSFKVVHQVTSIAVLHLDRLLIAVLVSVPAVAFYSVALELAQRLAIVHGNVALAFFPAACAMPSERDRPALAAMYERSSRAVALLTYPVAVTLIVLAEPVLRVWVGEEFALRGAQLLRLLAVAYTGMALTAIPVSIADALGRPEIAARFSILSVILNLTLTLLLVPRLGILGSGIAILATTAVLTAPFVYLITRTVLRVPVRRYVARALVEPLVPAIVVGAVFLAARLGGIVQDAAGIAATVAIGGVAFLASLRFGRFLDAEELGALRSLPGGRLLARMLGGGAAESDGTPRAGAGASPPEQSAAHGVL